MTLERTCKVAVIMSDCHPFHRTFAKNLGLELKAQDPLKIYAISYVTVALDSDFLRRRIFELINQKYDVIVTIGQRSSEIAKEVLDEIGGHPLIFVGVHDPVNMGLVNSLNQPSIYSSGVIQDGQPNLLAAEKLLHFAPYVTKVIMPYWSLGACGYLAKQAADIKLFFTRNGFRVEAIPINSSQGAVEAVEKHAGPSSCVLLLEGCLATEALYKISYLCWQRMTILCSDGRSSINSGSACAYGSSFRGFARGTLGILRQYHEEQFVMGQIPVCVLEDNAKFKVNVNMLRMIGLPTETIAKLCLQKDIEVMNEWIDSPLK